MLQKNTVEITGNVISEKMQCTFTRRLKGKFFSLYVSFTPQHQEDFEQYTSMGPSCTVTAGMSSADQFPGIKGGLRQVAAK